MFNLKDAIKEWRRQMLAAGIKNPEALDELESHLRDDVEHQSASGLSAEDAFHDALQRIGPVGELKTEFAKIAEVMSVGERRQTWILCAVCAVLDWMLGAFILIWANELSAPVAFPERLLAVSAWFVFPIIMWSWKYFYRFLPVFPGKRRRLAMAIGGSILGGLCSVIVLRCIPGEVAFPQLLVGLTVWAFIPLVVGLTLIFGLEEAAYRNLA